MKPSRYVQRGFSVHPDWIAALENVRFVLVGTTHPGNIGAVARVMKNMGLRNLILVSSIDYGPHTEAFSMASGSYDLVEDARQVSDLGQALQDSVAVAGTSARLGGKRVSGRTPDDLVPVMMDHAFAGPVSFVFGRESRGLTNEELKLCTHHLIIPSDREFASMNLAQAAAVVAYEIFKNARRPVGFQAKRSEPASVKVREDMYSHIEGVLIRAGFLARSNPLRMMRDIRRILNSADMDDRDAKIIRGIFRKIGNMIRMADEKIERIEKAGTT
jgi:tRNA (cytidine32/uridine32-2'-O)-methyltransferase